MDEGNSQDGHKKAVEARVHQMVDIMDSFVRSQCKPLGNFDGGQPVFVLVCPFNTLIHHWLCVRSFTGGTILRTIINNESKASVVPVATPIDKAGEEASSNHL